jgi:GTP-binding protein
MFIDESRLIISSGNGGNGACSFRREKYVDRGGPDGGDGGRGGNIIFAVRKNLKTFAHLQNKHKFAAPDGENGSKARRCGAHGKDIVIPLPPGSRIRDYKTRKVLLDLGTEEKEILFLKGGKGGKGNWNFKNSRNQAPTKTTKGQNGDSREILLELALIADIGFVGFPNAGKSSLLGALTAAKPKVADYPFTTKTPYLGVISTGDSDLILADIPGIIEGAGSGVGLGLRFLKHISRTAGLAFCIDMASYNKAGYEILLKELQSFSEELVSKPRLIVATKMDTENAEINFAILKEQYPDETIIPVSVHNHSGLSELIRAFWQLKTHINVESC